MNSSTRPDRSIPTVYARVARSSWPLETRTTKASPSGPSATEMWPFPAPRGLPPTRGRKSERHTPSALSESEPAPTSSKNVAPRSIAKSTRDSCAIGPEAALREQRDFRRADGDDHVCEEREGSDAGQQSDDYEDAANDLDHSDEWRHHRRRRNADPKEPAGAERIGVKKLLDPLGDKDPADEEAHEDHAGGGARCEDPAHGRRQARHSRDP